MVAVRRPHSVKLIRTLLDDPERSGRPVAPGSRSFGTYRGWASDRLTMEGTGVPLATPFSDGAVDHEALSELVAWVEDRGVDFIVPCGSTSEAPLMSADERGRTIETVCDAADRPVIAGTGHAGFSQTVESTLHAASAGADGVLVVTPFYYHHSQGSLAEYYEDLADECPVPMYLYSVPAYTDTSLEPKTVERLAHHPTIRGMKDSSGDLTAFQRIRAGTDDADFALLGGKGSVYAHALDAGGDGGILALANVAPALATEIYDRHANGDRTAARELNRELVELDQAVTTRYGISGLKAAMHKRGAPAGDPRRPHRSIDESAHRELEDLIAEVQALKTNREHSSES